MVVLAPNGRPFNALTWVLHEGTQLYRVFTAKPGRAVNTFNPGIGTTRFPFFGAPEVPVLYAAESAEAAIAESLLHDVPIAGGTIGADDYETSVMGRIVVQRELRLAKFMGEGSLSALQAADTEITRTEASQYLKTVAWSEAAHAAGFAGCVWMSRQYDSVRAYVLFGDHGNVATGDLRPDTSYGRIFSRSEDVDWLSDMCAPLHVQVLR